MKYLIEKLWIDPMENHRADGYSPFGYTNTKEEAENFCMKGKTFTKEDCWSLMFGSKPEYRYSELKNISSLKE
jgi:hypothetical protein